MKKLKVNEHIFEIVDYVPRNYKIWNIGKNMVDGYLPLVEIIGEHSVNLDTMKAIKVEGAQIVLSAIGGGQDTIEAMEKYVKRYKNAKIGTWSYRQKERMLQALPIMKSIKWEE